MSKPLNLPGRFARWFVDSKLTILIIIASLAAGIIAVLTTPREENPQISMPAAEVIIIASRREARRNRGPHREARGTRDQPDSRG